MKKCLFVLIITFCGIGITLFGFKKNHRVVLGNQYMVSVDGKVVNKIPSNGSYYLSGYDCDNKNTVVLWDKDRYEIVVSNGNKRGGVSCYLRFDSHPRLADMEVGSYVSYDSVYDGKWRVAYSKDNSAYLISEGVVSHMCSNRDGSIGESCDGVMDSSLASRHINHLNSISLEYCNNNYVYDGECNSDTVRNVSGADFLSMVNQKMNLGACYGVQSKKCGYVNDLIDIEDSYWYSDFYHTSSSDFLYWSSRDRAVSYDSNDKSYGVRPIIRLDSNVIVVDGDGSKENPYKISNQSFLIDSVDLKKNVIHMNMLGYGVFQMCINFNSAVCTNYVSFSDSYDLDVSNVLDSNVIYVYYKDKDGNIIASVHKKLLVG